MVYKVIENEHGSYKNSEGAHFDILEAINVRTPLGLNIGWIEYPNLDEVTKAYGLVFVEPEPKEHRE